MKNDVIVITGGSSGFGAAFRALSAGGADVVLCERLPYLGGTSTAGGVNTLEPGISGGGVHNILASRLIASGDGFVGKTVSFVSENKRYAVSGISDSPYSETLCRSGISPENQRRFHFEPKAMADEILRLLNEADKEKRLTLLLNSEFLSAEVKDGVITSCTTKTPSGVRIFAPKIVIDSSADIEVAASIG